MEFSKTQQGIINALRSEKYKLVDSFAGDLGGALWRTDIDWSQGRTPSNAVNNNDLQTLISSGVIEHDGFAWYLCRDVKTDKSIPFLPANEGYKGEPLIA